MEYNALDRTYIENLGPEHAHKHITALQELMRQNASYKEIFEYGKPYLPHVRNPNTGRIEISRLYGYQPEIVRYFEVVAEIPSLPNRLKDLATDVAIYANGETLQGDNYYLTFDFDAELKKALEESA